MPIILFFEIMTQKHIPIMLASDIYEQIIVPSVTPESEELYGMLVERLEYDYKLTLNAATVSWKDAVDIRISNRYKSLFETLEDCYSVMFEALHLIYICIAKDGLNGPDVHLFYFDKRPFIIKLTGKITYIYTPDDK